MKRTMMNLFVAGLALSLATVSFAKEPRVNQRQERQQKRIANGVQSGALTAHETGHIEKQESRLNKQVRTDRAANGGKLTGAEKVQINKEQNGLSKEIYQEKHDGETQQK